MRVNLHNRVTTPLAVSTLLLSATLMGCGGDDPVQQTPKTINVTINELQSRNSMIDSDTGKKSDWVELFNPMDAEQSLNGYFISDDPAAPEKAQLPPEATVPARGFLLLWLDDTNSAATPLHFPFKLSGSGDNFVLSNPSGQVIRNVAVPADPTGTDDTLADVSYGAYPDGSDALHWCTTPTPGGPNAADCSNDGSS